MPQRIPKKDLNRIEAVIAAHPNGIGIQDIENALEGRVIRRTLQYRLKHLVAAGRLVQRGERRWARYTTAAINITTCGALTISGYEPAVTAVPISKRAASIQQHLRKPLEARRPVGYDRKFLDAYRPNDSAYLSDEERAHLKEIGTASSRQQPAGTYAKQILNRLLIDLSWNSSRLEGNTYSLLDTKRLIDFGEEAAGKARLEAQMILNHKDAIEFLVGSAEEIGLNRHTILNLHALLANNLLADPGAPGRLRRMAVGIEKSAFHPLELPQLIEECFDQILTTAAAIKDPFEQSLFVMVQLPYLQPFDDVNERVSRLTANIPFIRSNVTPFSFRDVPAKLYTDAMLGIYELNEIDLLKDVFVWAYERSASHYAAIRQSIGEPDPFRLKYRGALREIVREIVLQRISKKSALAHIAAWSTGNIPADDREQFRELAESELLGLHEGNFARYLIRPSEFTAWYEIWANATLRKSPRNPDS